MSLIWGNYNFDATGVSNGTVMTNANSAFKNLVQAGWTFSNTHLLSSGGGTFAGRCAPSAATAIANDTGNPWSTSLLFYRFYLYIESLPTSTTTILQIRNASTNQMDVRTLTSGAIQIRNNAFVQVAVSGAYAAGTYIRVEGKYDGVNAQQQLKLFVGSNVHGTTADYDSGLVAAATGGAGTTNFQIGAVTSSTMVLQFDNLAFDDASWIGPVVSVNQPPSCNAGADQSGLEPWTALTLTATDSAVSPATITNRQWTLSSGASTGQTGATTNKLSYSTPPTIPGDTTVWKYTVTDSNGLTASDTVQISTLPVTERAVVGGKEVWMRPMDASSVTGPVLTRGDVMGVSISASDLMYKTTSWVDSRLDEVVALGAKWVRTDLNWSWIEGTQGTQDWTWQDYVQQACANRNLNLLFILGTTPQWLRPSTQPETYGPTTASEQQAFANWAGQAATRYLGKVEYFELWNEANLDQFWTPTPSASSYASLLKLVYPAIKNANPNAIVLSSGTGGAGASPDIASTTWYTNLYAAGAKNYFDIACCHPYMDVASAVAGTYNSGEMLNAATIRTTMNNNGDSGKHLWATECGMPTSGTNSCTEAQQTTTLGGGRDLWLSREPDGRFFIYTMRDRQAVGASGSTREDFFGLTRSDGTQKPAYGDEKTWIASG